MSDKEKSERRESDLEKDVFVHWLASSDDIFWITGKAGCGKSTLMKLIDDDPRTKEGLNQWIDNRCVRDEEWWIQSGCATAKPVCQGLFELFAKKQFKPEF
jgi:ABC-type polar amino acid transport system ATPase subunit